MLRRQKGHSEGGRVPEPDGLVVGEFRRGGM